MLSYYAFGSGERTEAAGKAAFAIYNMIFLRREYENCATLLHKIASLRMVLRLLILIVSGVASLAHDNSKELQLAM